MNRNFAVIAFALPLFVACGAAMEDDDSIQAQAAALRSTSPTTINAGSTVASLTTAQVVDPKASAAANADAIAAALQSKLKVCPTAQVTHQTGATTVTVDFGAGCTLSGYGTLSGAVSLSVSSQSGVAVAFTFTNLSVNGGSLNGTMSASTTDAKTYTTALDVTAASAHVVYSGTATLDTDYLGVTLSGTGSVQQKDATVAVPYTAAGVHHRFAGCYADTGTISFSETVQPRVGPPATVTEVVRFLSTTPQNGVVDVTIAGKTSQKTLPAYGKCPAA